MDRIETMILVRDYQRGAIGRRAFLRRAVASVGSLSGATLLLAACAPGEGDNPPVVLGTQPAEPEAALEGGITAGSIDYPGPDGATLSGYLARPDGDGTRPGVLVIQEWWGLNEHIKDVARRFAREGYVALAPDLYHGVVVSEPDEARKQAMALDIAAAVNEIHHAADALQARDDVAGRVGVVGFCMGGGLALQSARRSDAIGATVVFYGSPLSPDHSAEVSSPVLGHFGGADRGVPLDAALAMGETLEARGVPTEIHVYDDAPHAFFNDTRASYRPEAAELAWSRTLAWFEQHLGA